MTVYEENRSILWGLAVVVCTAAASIMLGSAFMNNRVLVPGIQQVIALILFMIAFYGIIKISEPLYRIEFEIDEYQQLTIKFFKGEAYIKTNRYRVLKIEEIAFVPDEPPSPQEALFDFSPSYHLTIKLENEPENRKILVADDAAITLRIDDIAKIVRFIKSHNPGVTMPEYQAQFFGFR
jgi:hypothetical protein